MDDVNIMTNHFMKLIRIITHPFLLIAAFLFILISGEHLGGFYLLYLLLALPYGGIHSFLALGGIAILLFAYYKYHRSNSFVVERILNITGSFLLVLSIIIFFYNDKQGYNNGTFNQVIPLVTLSIFSLVTLLFITDNIKGLTRSRSVPSS